MFVYYKTDYMNAFEILREGFKAAKNSTGGVIFSTKSLSPSINEMVLTVLLNGEIQTQEDTLCLDSTTIDLLKICEVKWGQIETPVFVAGKEV